MRRQAQGIAVEKFTVPGNIPTPRAPALLCQKVLFALTAKRLVTEEPRSKSWSQ